MLHHYRFWVYHLIPFLHPVRESIAGCFEWDHQFDMTFWLYHHWCPLFQKSRQGFCQIDVFWLYVRSVMSHMLNKNGYGLFWLSLKKKTSGFIVLKADFGLPKAYSYYMLRSWAISSGLSVKNLVFDFNLSVGYLSSPASVL